MRLDTDGAVSVLRMAEGKANTIDEAWLDEMERTLTRLESAPPGALVITGTGSVFCAGFDLRLFASFELERMVHFVDRFNQSMLRLFRAPLPVVAAINGHAIAGGCVLALQADYRIMAVGNAKVGLNEVALGIGLPRSVIETLRSQVVTPSVPAIAQEGRLLSGEEAHRLGLIHELSTELEGRALAKARELAALPRPAYGLVKETIRQPTVERILGIRDDAREWTASWFSDVGQRGIREALARMDERALARDQERG